MVARHRQKIPLKEDDNENFDTGLMRRSFSHSSPNIAKMMEDEDNAASGNLILQRLITCASRIYIT